MRFLQPPKLARIVNSTFTRNYVSEMRKDAFEGKILRLLRNEIQYEIDRAPPAEAVPEFNSFVVDERQGEQWICLKKKFGANEDIKIDATMFDASYPIEKHGGVATEDEVQLHLSLFIDVFKGEGNDILRIVCSAWPDSIEIKRVYTYKCNQNVDQCYGGPEFKELDDELQELLYDFLETRGINDDLAVFLHQYMKNKDKTEFIHWMGKVKSFIEKKPGN